MRRAVRDLASRALEPQQWRHQHQRARSEELPRRDSRAVPLRPVAEPGLITVGTPALARPSGVLGMASDVAAYNLPAQVRQLFGVTCSDGAGADRRASNR